MRLHFALAGLSALILLTPPSFAQEVAPRDGMRLDPTLGLEIGKIYQAWMTPDQEGGEEEDTPAMVPKMFKSVGTPVPRAERPDRGHGTLAFTKDLSRAYAHIKLTDVKLEDVTMFHIHCGRPGELGPIIVDFSNNVDLQKGLADGELSVEITNEDITAVTDHAHGLVGTYTSGCGINRGDIHAKMVTVAGLATIAAEGELYFNLHTKTQQYFGDIRGQLWPVAK
jgi:hypothetical protein